MGMQGKLQAHSRMRVPKALVKPAHIIHIVQAVRRNHVIDGESLYQLALREIIAGDSHRAFSNLDALLKDFTSGKLERDTVLTLASRVLHKAQLSDFNRASYTSVANFNEKFLNGNGLSALILSLVIDAADADLEAIDRARGGLNLQAAYGNRATKELRQRGKEIQKIIKKFPSLDEPAIKEAADRYVAFRFQHSGDISRYTITEELKGTNRSEKYVRMWFRHFDEALGFPSPRRGRPPKKSRKRGNRQATK